MNARVVVLAGLMVGCGSPQPQPKKVDPRPRKSIAENPPPAPKTEAEIQALTRPLTLGPAADASPEQRRAAVLALLTDGITVEHLSVDVADFGVEFDPVLAERLALHQRRSPQLRFGKIRVAGEGELDADVIRRIARSHYQHLRGCYEKSLIATPGAQGRLVLEFEISFEGKVENPKISDKTIESEPLEACVLEATTDWKFPRPKAGAVTVSYPLGFTPE